MDVQILGPLRVLRDGVELDLGRPKQRLLLAVLVAAGGDTVSVDRLVDELWGDEPPPRVASSVQAYVSKLRNALEPDRPARAASRVLVTRAPGYALVLPPDALDATLFAREADEVRQLLQAGRYERAHSLAGEALARWRGDVLADLTDEAVAQREAPRWDSLRLAVTEDRLHAAIELGLHTTAMSDLEVLVDDHPLRERSLGLLLRALYLGGRPVEALERYRVYRTHLQEELGLDPGTELRTIEAAILRQDPSLLPAAPRTRPVADVAPAPASDDAGDEAATRARARPDTARDGRGFVGRTDELDLGSAIVDDVVAGRPRWLTLAGEPGIGKTRLAEAIADRAAAAGVEVSWGRCHEDDDAPAYWPWSQLLRGIVPDATDPIAGLLADETSPDPATQRYRLHERVTDLLLAGEPRLLIVDDAQWADPASLQLLGFLAVQVRAGHLGILLTVRTGASAGPDRARATLAAIARHPGAAHRVLGPLGPAELAELSSLVTGVAPAPEELAALHERCAGNPFFATELLRLPAHRGGRAEPPLPAAVREVIERRLAPLGDDVRATLDLAAVVGASFDLPIVEGASGMDPDRLFDALDLAVASGLVVPADGVGAFRFSHALVRDTLLADLSPMRRQRTHARVAEALEHRPRRDPARHAAELAHHLVAAAGIVGEPTARAAAERAAAAAEERLAFEEAAGWWSTARDLLGAEDDAPTADRLGVALGRALLLAGRIDDGRAALCEVMDAAHRRGDAIAEATAGIAIALSGGAWYWVRPGESPFDVVTRLERAAGALGHADHPLRVGLLVTAAQGVYYAEPDRAVTLVDEALAIARRLGDPHLLAMALVGAMGGDWGPASRDRHLERSAELLGLPAEVRSPELELAARLWRLTALAEAGDLDAARAELARADAIAEASGRQILRAQVAIARIGMAWLGDGGLAAVEAAVVRAADLHRRSGLYGEDAVPLANRMVVHLLHGDVADLGDVLPLASQVGAFGSVIEAVDRLVDGDRDGAVAILAAAPAAPRTWQWLGGQVLRTLLAVDTGAVELAAPLRDALAPHVGIVAVTGTTMSAYGPVTYHVGELDLLLDDLGAAAEHLRAAVEHADALGATIWAALARVALGEALTRAGDRAAAREQLTRGRDQARRLGLAVAADRATAWLDGAPR
jgi:DNA-binding SARP family transcriptional activator